MRALSETEATQRQPQRPRQVPHLISRMRVQTANACWTTSSGTVGPLRQTGTGQHQSHSVETEDSRLVSCRRATTSSWTVARAGRPSSAMIVAKRSTRRRRASTSCTARSVGLSERASALCALCVWLGPCWRAWGGAAGSSLACRRTELVTLPPTLLLPSPLFVCPRPLRVLFAHRLHC